MPIQSLKRKQIRDGIFLCVDDSGKPIKHRYAVKLPGYYDYPVVLYLTDFTNPDDVGNCTASFPHPMNANTVVRAPKGSTMIYK